MKLSELKAWVANATSKTINRIADLKAGKGANYKLRISVVERVTGITWGRVKSLKYSESRRIDAHEWIRLQQAQEKAEQEEIARKKHEAEIWAARTAALLSGEGEDEMHPALRDVSPDHSTVELQAREMAKAIRLAEVG